MIGLLDKNLTQNLYIGQKKKYAYHNFANDKLIVESLDRAIQAYHSWGYWTVLFPKIFNVYKIFFFL